MTQIKSTLSAAATFVISILMTVAAIAQTQPQPQPTPDAREILKKVAQNTQSAKSFQIEGQTSFEMKSDGILVRVDLPFVVAQSEEGKYRAEIRVPIIGQVLFLSDGKTEWMYFAFDKEYSKKPATKSEDPKSLEQVSSVFRMFGLPFADVAGADANNEVKAARVLREETIKVGSDEIVCYVVEVEYDLSKNPLMDMANSLLGAASQEKAEATPEMEKLGKLQKAVKEGSGKATMWIDKERSLVVRHNSTGGLLGQLLGALGDAGAATISTDMKTMKVNEKLADSLFSFTPPEGAKEKVEKTAEPESGRIDLVGTPAVDFALKDLNGNAVSLESLRGKVVVLDFWASWCGPCRETMPHIEKLHRDFKAKGLVLFGVNDEDAATARRFMEKNGYTFPTLIDGESSLSDQYGVRSIPQTIVIDRDGKVFAHFLGTGEEENLRQVVTIALGTKAEKAAKPAKKATPRTTRVAAKSRR